MKLCIAGSRGIVGERGVLLVRMAVAEAMEHGPFEFRVQDIELIISGTARGVDSIGEQLAAKHHIPVRRMPADWDRFGKRAGMIRNKEMAHLADLVVVVWDGRSPGSRQMYDYCTAIGKPVYLFDASKVPD